MKAWLGPQDLIKYTDAQLDDLLRKVEILGGKGVLRDSLKREIIRRREVHVTPGMVNASEPWLVQVAPGKWVTATTADLMASSDIARHLGRLTPEDVQRTLKQLLEAGMIRPNPARARVEEMK